MTDFRHTLGATAGTTAKRALAAYVNRDLPDFFLFAGVAVERAMKARLARVNPAFIAPKDKFSAAVRLTRAADDGTPLPHGTPTVTASEALARMIEIDPSFKAHESGVRELLALRNGEAHVGTSDHTHERRALVSFLRAINALLKADADKFWSPDEQLVHLALDENAQAIQRDTQMQLSRARMRIAEREESLGAQFAVFLATMESQVDQLVNDDALKWDCPACENAAILSGVNDVEVEYDADGPCGEWVAFYADSLSCPACGLELEQPDEVEAAGIDIHFENETVDIDEFRRDDYEDF